MPERIVDVFEAIQIHKEYGDFLRVARSQDDGLAHAVIKEHAIRQTGQKVVLSRVGHLCGHGPRCGSVTENDYRSSSLSSPVMDGGNGILDWRFESITPNEDTVRWQAHGLVSPCCQA